MDSVGARRGSTAFTRQVFLFTHCSALTLNRDHTCTVGILSSYSKQQTHLIQGLV